MPFCRRRFSIKPWPIKGFGTRWPIPFATSTGGQNALCLIMAGGSGVRFEKSGRKPILYHVPHNGKKELPTYVIEQLRIAVGKEL